MSAAGPEGFPKPCVDGLFAEISAAGLLGDAHRCAREYAVSTDAVLSMRRERPDCLARFAFWAFLHFECKWSYPRIARYWRCDHTTVMGGVKTFLCMRREREGLQHVG